MYQSQPALERSPRDRTITIFRGHPSTMSFPIPRNPQEILALRQTAEIDNEIVASAIVGLIQIARDQGKTLPELQAELLAEDPLLSQDDRIWLSNLVATQWGKF